jgi:hypothetical protein
MKLHRDTQRKEGVPQRNRGRKERHGKGISIFI